LVLKNLITLADKNNAPAKFTWDELNSRVKSLQNQELDYYTFLSYMDQDPLVKALVVHFDDNGLELKSKNSTISPDTDQGGQEVSKMAKRATQKRRG
jgi:hypothetical protein